VRFLTREAGSGWQLVQAGAVRFWWLLKRVAVSFLFLFIS
jgi:hypothetical protein